MSSRVCADLSKVRVALIVALALLLSAPQTVLAADFRSGGRDAADELVADDSLVTPFRRERAENGVPEARALVDAAVGAADTRIENLHDHLLGIAWVGALVEDRARHACAAKPSLLVPGRPIDHQRPHVVAIRLRVRVGGGSRAGRRQGQAFLHTVRRR